MTCNDIAALLSRFGWSQDHLQRDDLTPAERQQAIDTNEAVVAAFVQEIVHLGDQIHALTKRPLRELAVMDRLMEWPQRVAEEAVKGLARKEVA